MTACRSSGRRPAAATGRRTALGSVVCGAVLIAVVFLATAGAPPAAAQTRGPILLGPPTPLAPAAPGDGSVPTPAAPPPFAAPSLDVATPPPPRTTADGAIRIEGLKRVTADAAGTLTPASGGLRSDLWQGTPGPIALRLLALLPAAPDSQGMRGLQRRMLLSSGPAPADLPGEGAMLAARAERLLAMGALDELMTLAGAVPGRADDPALARSFAEAALALGEDATACGHRDAVASRADDRFWVKLGVLCDLSRGDAAKAELGTRLLGEIGEQDPLLQEAVQAAVAGRAGGPNRLAGAEPLHLAAARIAKMPIDPDVAMIDSLPVLVALSRGIGDPPFAARLAAAERAERAGAVSAQALIELYAEIAVEAGPVDGALRVAEADQTAYARGLLWRTAEMNGDSGQRARVIRTALELSEDGSSWRQTARLFAPLIRRLTIDPAAEPLAPDAIRILVAAGEPAAARPWLEWLRTRVEAGSPEARTALRRLWVMARIGGGDLLVPYREASVAAWWDDLRDASPEDASNLGGAALTLLDALGAPIGVDAWRGLAAAPSTILYEAPTAAFRNGVAAGAEAGRLAETVALATAGFGEVPLHDLDPTAVAGVVRALRRLGLEDDARRLAGEAAVAYGL